MAEPSSGGTEAGSAGSRDRAARSTAPLASRLARFTRDARGSTAMEYALIGGLIFVVAAGSIRYYASRMVNVYSQISTTVTQAN